MDAQTLTTLGTSLIVALATVIGSAITAYFGYKSVKATADMAKTKEEMASVKRELIAAYRQISAYYQLEQEFIEAVKSANGGTEKSLKISHRDKVVEKGFERPKITHNQAEKRIRELEI
ncbi:hypothetical protein [Nitrosomonas sp.]|uniref:hypothetical protein n=1 Tax=Nitrosomonas sp. TaxID=42353 RepID=UPI0025F7D131|nr:hypothetical protein [Nitrosomonas sp.]MCC6916955.1 hypothetical protein [Nitrosomonas sp.]